VPSAEKGFGHALLLSLPLTSLGLANDLFILQALVHVSVSGNFLLSSVEAFTSLSLHLSVYLTLSYLLLWTEILASGQGRDSSLVCVQSYLINHTCTKKMSMLIV
jgi:hypothetical protein